MSLVDALEGKLSFYNDSQQVIKNFHEYGFHIEKNFLEPEYCDLLVEQANQLEAARDNNFRPALMPHKENKVFLEAMKNKKAVEILAALLGGNPMGVQTQFFYCKPGTRGFSLHQDNFYIQANPNVFISIWVALVDTSVSNGGLYIYPGSHKEGNLPVRKLNLDDNIYQDKNANNEETVVPEKYKSCDAIIKKGSAIFIHGQIAHGSHNNQSDHCRYSLLNLYVKEGEAFRSGNSAHREPIALT